MVLVEHVTWCRRSGGGGSSVKSFHHSEVGSAGTEVKGKCSGRREIVRPLALGFIPPSVAPRVTPGLPTSQVMVEGGRSSGLYAHCDCSLYMRSVWGDVREDSHSLEMLPEFALFCPDAHGNFHNSCAFLVTRLLVLSVNAGTRPPAMLLM